ncbi:MAG: hypothetical protein ACKOEG_06955, partial [Chthoniobacterales bacterium]
MLKELGKLQNRKNKTGDPEIARCEESLRATLNRPAELLDPIEARLDRLEIGRVAEAHGLVVTEGDTRHHGDLGFAEQPI